MKGIGPAAIAIIVAIFSVGVLIAVTIPAIATKIHFVNILTIEYKYNNAQLSLLALLSSTHEKEETLKLLSLHLAGIREDKSFLENKLNKTLVCYNLSSSHEVLANSKSNECSFRYKAFAKIPLPYNPQKLVENIQLVID